MRREHEVVLRRGGGSVVEHLTDLFDLSTARGLDQELVLPDDDVLGHRVQEDNSQALVAVAVALRALEKSALRRGGPY